MTNIVILSALSHKESRFITCIVLIGQIAQGYMITIIYDCREVLLQYLKLNGYNENTSTFKSVK